MEKKKKVMVRGVGYVTEEEAERIKRADANRSMIEALPIVEELGSSSPRQLTVSSTFDACSFVQDALELGYIRWRYAATGQVDEEEEAYEKWFKE